MNSDEFEGIWILQSFCLQSSLQSYPAAAGMQSPKKKKQSATYHIYIYKLYLYIYIYKGHIVFINAIR